VAGRSVDGVEHSTLEELEKSVKSSEMLFTICTDRGIEGGVLLRRGLPLQPGTNGIRDLAACGVHQDARYELRSFLCTAGHRGLSLRFLRKCGGRDPSKIDSIVVASRNRRRGWYVSHDPSHFYTTPKGRTHIERAGHGTIKPHIATDMGRSLQPTQPTRTYSGGQVPVLSSADDCDN
jgi:hypothetical protein